MSKKLQTRKVLCPRCDHSFDVGIKTMSILCPGCRQNVRTENVKIDGYWASTEFYTAGDVTVEKKGAVVAEVRADNLTVKGEVKGDVLSRGVVKVTKTGKVLGDVSARTLAVEEGAILLGRFEILPGSKAPDSAIASSSLPR